MPDLIHCLQEQDPGYARIVAELWGVDYAPLESDALKSLAASLLEAELVAEIVAALPAECRQVLGTLAAAGGRLPWAGFIRQAGELRPAGAGRRDREQIYQHPNSVTETLFYRALIGRAFFDTTQGLQEFAYIPDDLLAIVTAILPKTVPALPAAPEQPDRLGTREPPGRLATPRERQQPMSLCDRLPDDAATLLAALRLGTATTQTVIPANVVADLLRAAGILAGNDPQPEKVRPFLEASRSAALKQITSAWRESRDVNELRQMPGLVCEGEWQNDPYATRHKLLDLLRSIPRGRWWSLQAFILGIQERSPDIQRSGGEYDTWFIKRKADGEYLCGFSSWEQVEGELIRYLICGPMYWLGLVQLACPEGEAVVTAFCIQQTGKMPARAETQKLTTSSQGRIRIPRYFPRPARYQLARFCDWEDAREDEYTYRISTRSLRLANAQGLKVNQLLSLLAKHAAAEVPPSLIRALKRWETNGTEARVEVQTILHVSRPEVLEELRSSKAGRFLGEVLGPVTVIVNPAAGAKILATLAEMGLLAEETRLPEDAATGK